jgi:hypothetical protein
MSRCQKFEKIRCLLVQTSLVVVVEMNVLEVQALVNFYTQKGFHRHVQSLCKDVLKKRPNEPTLMFWRAFAIAAEGLLSLLHLLLLHSSSLRIPCSGNTSDSIRELEELQGKPDVALAVASCLVQTHKSAKYKGNSCHLSFC